MKTPSHLKNERITLKTLIPEFYNMCVLLFATHYFSAKVKFDSYFISFGLSSPFSPTNSFGQAGPFWLNNPLIADFDRIVFQHPWGKSICSGFCSQSHKNTDYRNSSAQGFGDGIKIVQNASPWGCKNSYSQYNLRQWESFKWRTAEIQIFMGLAAGQLVAQDGRQILKALGQDLLQQSQGQG